MEKEQKKQHEALDVHVSELIENGTPMYDILKTWPMQDEQDAENFQTDEEPEHEDQEEDMKVYQEKLNAKINVLVDALKEVHHVITTDENKKNISGHFDDYIKEH